MALFQQPVDVSALHQEIDGLQKYVVRLIAEKDVLIEDLKGYETEGYEQFKKVLAKEKIRIALLRMTVATGEENLHREMKGQFDECELLERNKTNLETAMTVNARKIEEASVKIARLSKQLKSRTERKL
jgi:hypothetical protein